MRRFLQIALPHQGQKRGRKRFAHRARTIGGGLKERQGRWRWKTWRRAPRPRRFAPNSALQPSSSLKSSPHNSKEARTAATLDENEPCSFSETTEPDPAAVDPGGYFHPERSHPWRATVPRGQDCAAARCQLRNATTVVRAATRRKIRKIPATRERLSRNPAEARTIEFGVQTLVRPERLQSGSGRPQGRTPNPSKLSFDLSPRSSVDLVPLRGPALERFRDRDSLAIVALHRHPRSPLLLHTR